MPTQYSSLSERFGSRTKLLEQPMPIQRPHRLERDSSAVHVADDQLEWLWRSNSSRMLSAV